MTVSEYFPKGWLSAYENTFLIFQFEPKALFGGSQAKSPSKDDGDDKVEEYEPQVDFQPVVPLPDLVEVKTGEWVVGRTLICFWNCSL